MKLSTPLLWSLTLILLFAFALRVYQLESVPLRGDEAYAAIHWTKTPFSPAWMTLIEYEPNPGALITYWAWTGFVGVSEFALRMLPVLANVLGLAVVVRLCSYLNFYAPHPQPLSHKGRGEKTIDPVYESPSPFMGEGFRVGVRMQYILPLLVLAALWAVNPFFVWHAQDARQYSLLTMLTPLNFYLFLRAVDRNSRRDWMLYLLAQTFTVYLYYIELFWIAAMGVYLLIARRDRLRKAFSVWIVMGVLLLPLFVQIYYVLFVREYSGTASSANVNEIFTHFIPTLLFGENTFPLWLGIIVTALLTAGIYAFAPRRWLLLAWIYIPLGLLFIASTQSALFRPRYVIGIAPALLIGIAFTAVKGGSQTRPYIISLSGFKPFLLEGRNVLRPYLASWRFNILCAVVLLMCVVSLVEIQNYFTVDPPKAADWRGLVAYLDERTTPNDVMISDSIDPALEYYYKGAAGILFIPEDTPSPENFIPQVLENNDGIYLLVGERTGDTGQYLQAHAQHVPGDQWGNIVQYRPWQVNPREIQHPLALQFGDIAILRGYTVLPNAIIMLYWEPLTRTETDHSILLHLESRPDAPPVSLDHAIAGAVVSTRTWDPGTLYRDPVALPADLTPGDYLIRVGMYPTGTNELIAMMGSSAEDRRYPIGQLVIAD